MYQQQMHCEMSDVVIWTIWHLECLFTGEFHQYECNWLNAWVRGYIYASNAEISTKLSISTSDPILVYLKGSINKMSTSYTCQKANSISSGHRR